MDSILKRQGPVLVCVTHVESPVLFWVCELPDSSGSPVHRRSNQVSDVLAAFQRGVCVDFPVEEGQLFVYRAQIGTHEKKHWVRARVIKVSFSAKQAYRIWVRLIDVGNTCEVHKEDLRVCPDEIKDVPDMAVQFHLRPRLQPLGSSVDLVSIRVVNVDDSQWPSGAHRRIIELLKDSPTFNIVDYRPTADKSGLEGCLIANSTEGAVNIGAFLVDNGFARMANSPMECCPSETLSCQRSDTFNSLSPMRPKSAGRGIGMLTPPRMVTPPLSGLGRAGSRQSASPNGSVASSSSRDSTSAGVPRFMDNFTVKSNTSSVLPGVGRGSTLPPSRGRGILALSGIGRGTGLMRPSDSFSFSRVTNSNHTPTTSVADVDCAASESSVTQYEDADESNLVEENDQTDQQQPKVKKGFITDDDLASYCNNIYAMSRRLVCDDTESSGSEEEFFSADEDDEQQDAKTQGEDCKGASGDVPVTELLKDVALKVADEENDDNISSSVAGFSANASFRDTICQLFAPQVKGTRFVFNDFSTVTTAFDDSVGLSNFAIATSMTPIAVGELVPKPMASIGKTGFHQLFIDHLRQTDMAPRYIQAAVWPAVARKRFTFCIAAPHSGKTMAYLAPVVSALLCDLESGIHPGRSNCPMAFILCSEAMVAQSVYDLLNRIIPKKRGRRTSDQAMSLSSVVLYAGGAEKDMEMQILNGVDILIATPPSFLRVYNCIKSSKPIMSFERCGYFIIDDADNLLYKFPQQFEQILTEYRKCLKNHKSVVSSMVVCAEQWTPLIAELYSVMKDAERQPILYFGAFLEAAVCAKMKCFVHYSANKLSILSSILRGTTEHSCVVCVEDQKRAGKISDFINCDVGFSTILLTEDMSQHVLLGSANAWNEGRKNCILVCSDSVLGQVKVERVTCLIHLDIPRQSKARFVQRYALISDTLRDMCSQSSSETCSGISHVIINASDRSIAVPVMTLLNRLDCPVFPDEFIRLVDEELKRNPPPLCISLILFGHCRKALTGSCRARHEFFENVDKPCDYVPKEGRIRVCVTSVEDANAFYARVVTHGTVDSERSFAEENTAFLESVHADALKNDDSIDPVVGKIYATRATQDGMYHRVLILSVISTGVPRCVVRHIDYGHQSTIPVDTLRRLSDDICSKEPLAIRVIACKVQPLDTGETWSKHAQLCSQEHFLGKIVIGDIQLALGNTIWVNPFIVKKSLDALKKEINEYKLREKLISCGFGEDNPDHIERLRKLCIAAKIPVPKLFSSPSIESNIGLQRYAFLSMNTGPIAVFISEIKDNLSFYCQRETFIDTLDDLEDAINDFAKSAEAQRMTEVTEGLCVIAPLKRDDGTYRYHRALVRGTVEQTVSLFFPDDGSSGQGKLDELFAIPNNMVSRLPFQAIKCRFAGVEPLVADGYGPLVADKLCDYTFDDKNNQKLFHVVVHSKDNEAGVTFVSVWNDGVDVARKLCDDGLIKYTPVSDEVVNIPRRLEDEEEYDSDVEDLQDQIYAENFFRAVFLGDQQAGSDVSNAITDTDSIADTSSRTSVMDQKDFNPIRTSEGVPAIVWFESGSTISIHIRVHDVTECDVRLDDDEETLNVSLQVQDSSTPETLQVRLWSSVDSTSMQGSIVHNGVQITFTKVDPTVHWPQLTRDRRPNTRYDMRYYRPELDLDDEQIVNFGSLPLNNNNNCSVEKSDKPILHYDIDAHNEQDALMERDEELTLEEILQPDERNGIFD